MVFHTLPGTAVIMLRTHTVRLLVAIAFASVFMGTAVAQEFRATLSGRVTDAQGAVLAGTRIVLVNQESQARTETVSGADGFYNIPFLTPAAYTITVES